MISKAYNMSRLLILIVFLYLGSALSAQEDGKVRINGKYFPYTIDECGDTLILADLADVSVTSLHVFETSEDESRYKRFKQYALKVHPYAVEAIKVFRQVEFISDDMKKGKRRKYVKQLQQDLKEQFRDPLMDLTKTQGMILFKMIERELDTPIYQLVKNLRGGLTSTYWQTMGSMYGHNLKEGYVPGQDPILDAVLEDLDVSYKVLPQKSAAKPGNIGTEDP